MKTTRPAATALLASIVAVLMSCLFLQAAHAQSETGLGRVSESASGQDLATVSDESPARRRARIRMELAAAYFGQGQLATALDEIKQAIVLDESYSQAYEMRGLIYDALNEPKFAEDSLRRSLSLNPKNGSAAHNLAWFFCRKRDFVQAEKFFAIAAELPNYVSLSKTLMARGACQMSAGNLVEAEKHLLRAHEMDPSNPAVAFNLALVLYREAQYQRAQFYIRRVNNMGDKATAESLWLGIRVAHKLNNMTDRAELIDRLKTKFPSAREVTALELGRFDD